MCSCRILGRHAGILWGRRLARLKSSMQRPQFGMTKRRPANSNSSYKISNDRFLHMHVSNKSQFSCHKDRCVTYQIREGVVNQVESDLEGCNYCKNLINTVLHYFVFLLMYFFVFICSYVIPFYIVCCSFWLWDRRGRSDVHQTGCSTILGDCNATGLLPSLSGPTNSF